ncbi:MAG: hypothetical protein ABI949_11705 [Ilumatobacteraceae bacterium]
MPVDVLNDTAESAIRAYLLFLEDPRKLIDRDRVARLRTKAKDTKDPVERLRVYAELERAESSDETAYKGGFVQHAKNWAAANSVGPAAFRQLGVADDVLRSAGLVAAEARRARAVRKHSSSVGRTSVTAESIKAHVRTLRGTFTMVDIQASVGGSPMTVRKAVQALVDDGTIKRLGPIRDWHGRGRAPIAFEAR